MNFRDNISHMNNEEKIIIIEKAKTFFIEKITVNHLSALKKLTSLSSFSYNPFLLKYLASFLTGNTSPESLAKALIYPRVLGTSIVTIFGTQSQSFCKEVLNGVASVVAGIDIEFIDQVDGRKKYCQTKAGPTTINKDDVETIFNHFKGIKGLARTNGLDVRDLDLVVGVMYGKKEELSANYLKIQKDYPVYTGQEFWYRLTGDKDFYFDLIKAFGDVSKTINVKEELELVVTKLSEDIKAHFPELLD